MVLIVRNLSFSEYDGCWDTILCWVMGSVPDTHSVFRSSDLNFTFYDITVTFYSDPRPEGPYIGLLPRDLQLRRWASDNTVTSVLGDVSTGRGGLPNILNSGTRPLPTYDARASHTVRVLQNLSRKRIFISCSHHLCYATPSRHLNLPIAQQI